MAKRLNYPLLHFLSCTLLGGVDLSRAASLFLTSRRGAFSASASQFAPASASLAARPARTARRRLATARPPPPCCSRSSPCYCKASASLLLAQLALPPLPCCSTPNQVQPWLEVAVTGADRRPGRNKGHLVARNRIAVMQRWRLGIDFVSNLIYVSSICVQLLISCHVHVLC
jgi:hypothetical protein